MAMEKQNTLFSDNPITRAELSYQGQPVPHRRGWRRWFGWIGRAVTLFAYVLTLIMSVSEVAMSLLNLNVSRGLEGGLIFVESIGVLNLIPLCVVVVMHFSLMIQTLSRSANSVARERQGNNWDMLVLTGIDASRIVWGKWWATVRHLWRPYLRLGIFRAAMIIGYGLYISRPYYFYNSSQNYNRPDVIAPTLPHFIVAVFFICTLTFANLFFTAACGVSAFNKRSSIAMARAIGTRLLILIGIGMITVFMGWLLFRGSYDYDVIQQIGLRALATLFDNGVIMGGEAVTYQYSFSGNSYFPAFNTLWLPGAFVALAVYALLTFLLLHFARWQAVRLNALPPSRRKLIEIV
jgi:hypothetical protein